MVEREFIGWDRPFLHLAAEWLLARKERLPGMIVVVPTSQSGRRLRECLAETAGALLSPRIVTPAWFLRTDDPDIAPDWAERLAWMETLEAVDDWSPFQALFPEAPEADGNWSASLATAFHSLRRRLQENGHTFASAARILASTVDADRWRALADLEKRTEALVLKWGMRSRSRVLAGGLRIPGDLSGIVLAGVTEMPPLVERALAEWPSDVRVLIGAPADEADGFSPTGRPLEGWTERVMPWPDGDAGSVRLAADPGQQATEAFRMVCDAGLPSNEVALGSADPEVSGTIARVFHRGGWTAFDPSAEPAVSGLARFLVVWSKWLETPRLAQVQDLLALPETGFLIGGKRATRAETLSRARDQWMVTHPADLHRKLQTLPRDADPRREEERRKIEDLAAAVDALDHRRSAFLKGDFIAALSELLDEITARSADQTSEADFIRDWLDEAAPLIGAMNRSATFWLDLVLSEIPRPAPSPPEGRVIDVLGWLELFFEPGRHLVICGMNEGRVPNTSAGDPWLGEAASRLLGIVHNAQRAARDAYLHFAMIMARRLDGRVDLICAKSGTGGEPLLPSRLLLAAERPELPQRVAFLFQEVQPPEAGLRWQADWLWQPAPREIPKRLHVTSLRDWLACPFRFHLKHSLAMQQPEPDRVEWNNRDFGNVAHAVLETWGLDENARTLNKTEALEAWFSSELDKVVASWFGDRPPLAIRVQTESLRRRLAWLARVQAIHCAESWETIHVEHKFEIPIGRSTVVARIDRIDRHRGDGRLRVIDYKTGSVEDVAREHRRKLTARSEIPAHLPEGCPVFHQAADRGKPADFRWVNLQLPLYALAIQQRDSVIPEPCYFTIGSTEAAVDLVSWQDFSQADLDAARDCAEWVVDQIEAGIFWPPAETVTYDDFAALTGGRRIEECFARPAGDPEPPAA